MRLLGQVESRGYLNFDDERLVGVTDYDRLIAAVNAVYGNPRHLLLDEIQNLPRWDLFVNRLQRQGLRLLLTGSNAHLLSSELATHLTGRHLPLVLFPFSFAEALRAFPATRTGPELIQVCWDLTGERTRQREFRALLQAGRDLACDRLLVLTADTDSEEEVEWYGNRVRIRLLPVWRWLHDPN